MSRSAQRAALFVCLAWVLHAPAVFAANCGGSVPCQCGDAVSVDYVMTGDLGPCPGHGLVIRSNVSLDCQGWSVVGLGDGSDQYGIYLDGDTGAEVTGATVQRCEVSRFLRGIRLRAAEQSAILGNYSHDNGDFVGHVGYGIDIAVGSKGNLLQGNTIESNADEGIHFGSGTGPNQFVSNVLFDNYREQIYVLSSDGNTFVGNTTSGSGSNSLYLKDSNNNYLEDNTFKDRTARVTGDASGNLFANNSFVNATLQFRVYDSATPHRIPTDNSVAGGSMTSTGGTCIRFTRTLGNVVSDVTLNGCGTEVLSESTAAEPSSNTIVSMPLDSSKVSVDANSTLAVGWWLDVHVQDAAGAPVPGARVQALDVGGSLVFDLLTDAGGNLPPQSLLQYVRFGSSTAARTPHTLNTSKSGYLADSRILQADQDLGVSVVLSPSTGGGGSGSFSDNFNRSNSTVLGNGWLEVQGDLLISGDELRNAALKGNHVAVLPALSGASQSAAADFASVDNNPGPRFGVVLRYQDPRSYYVLYRTAGGTSALRISKVVSGVETVLAWMPIGNPGLNGLFHLGGRVTGTTLTLELAGVPKLSVSDSTFKSGSLGILLGAGSSSVRSYRADNFSASVQ